MKKEVHEIEADLKALEDQKSELLKIDTKDITDENLEELEKVNKQITETQKELVTAKKKEAFEAEKIAASLYGAASEGGEARELGKIAKNYSFREVINKAVARAQGKAGNIEGLELEMHQEAEKEATGLPGGISGTGVPSKLMSFQRKDLTVGSATSAGNTVATDLSNELIPALRPQLMTQALGARVRTGMTSNFDIARKTGETSMTWEGENDANAEGTPTTDLLQVRPNRGGVTVDISKQLLIQSSFDVEQMIREDIEFAIARGLDLAAINGSGASNQPRGILNTSGIGSVAIGTNGGVITYEKLVALKKAIAVDDALMGNLAFLTNPDVVSELEVTPRQGSGVEGNFIKNVDSEKLLSYRLGQSTQVPNTLTKGTSSGVCSALIFGNWSELSIYQFGGLDIVVDPYSKKTTSLVEITINSWWDIVVRHAQSFAAIQDLTTTQVS